MEALACIFEDVAGVGNGVGVSESSLEVVRKWCWCF